MMPMDSGLLEDWLRKVAYPPSKSSKFAPALVPSVHHIAHAWGQLRTCVQSGSLEQDHLAALIFLKDCGHSLHVAEPQARVLLSILSSVTSADAAALGQARGSAAMLLSIWIRKASKFSNGSWSRRHSSKISPEILNALVDSSLKALDSCGGGHKDAFVSEVMLLVGTLCGAEKIKEDSRRICQEILARECLQQKRAIVQGRLHEALAGVGYAIASSRGPSLAALVGAVLLLWSDEQGMGKKDQMLDSPCLEDGLVLLHLMEWCGSTFTSQPQLAGAALAQVMVDGLLQSKVDNKTSPVNCAIVLSAAGLLRSFYQLPLHVQHDTSREPTWQSIMQSLQSLIANMADAALELQVKMILTENIDANIHGNSLHSEKSFHLTGLPAVPVEDRHCLQCLALALSRCARFPPHPSILLCLTVVLLEYAMPLSTVYGKPVMEMHQDLEGPEGNGLQRVQGKIYSSMQKHLVVHVEGILFHGAGAICRAVCEQYRSADKGWQLWVENLIWKYSHVLYQSHRYFLAVIKRDADSQNELLRKVFEVLLLSVVMLYSFVTREKTGADLYDKGQLAVRVLSSLSCIEFIRQGQVPEYGDLVQRSVAWVSTNEAACANLVNMFPSYDDVIYPPGSALASYNWTEDKVQDARVLFCFRVLPSCLNKFPASSFVSRVAPLMLLYIQHPTHHLAQASHSLFVAFLSCNGDVEVPRHPWISQEISRDPLKESLAVRYIERTLEEFRSVSRFDFLVMGVGAIVRHLPAGSAATVYCINCLTKKANELFKYVFSEHNFAEHNTSLEGLNKETGNALETAKRFQILLLHLILVVDIQVLPQLLQETARLILGLPDPYQTEALEEAFDILAGSDDLTRKHILVPWLQSLSYLCSNSHEQGKGKSHDTRSRRVMENSLEKSDVSDGIEVCQSGGAINFNPSSALEECRHTHGPLRTERANDVSSLPWTSRSRL